jgi:hypothetical protein
MAGKKATLYEVAPPPPPPVSNVMFEALVVFTEPLTLDKKASAHSNQWPYRCVVDMRNRMVILESTPRTWVPFERVAKITPV